MMKVPHSGLEYWLLLSIQYCSDSGQVEDIDTIRAFSAGHKILFDPKVQVDVRRQRSGFPNLHPLYMKLTREYADLVHF